jgi:hypothetical protein
VSAPYTGNSEQSVLNQAFDETYKVLLVSPVVFNGQAMVSPSSSLVATRLDDTTTSNVTYVGVAAPASLTSATSWQVKKIDETTGMVITWADGNTNFDNVWDNRASLTYS